MKRCGKCRRRKPLSEFHRCACQPDGLHSTCRSCRSIQREKYRQHHALDLPRELKPDDSNRPDLVDGRCWMPGCWRPSIDGFEICRYHHAVFVEEGALTP